MMLAIRSWLFERQSGVQLVLVVLGLLLLVGLSTRMGCLTGVGPPEWERREILPGIDLVMTATIPYESDHGSKPPVVSFIVTRTGGAPGSGSAIASAPGFPGEMNLRVRSSQEVDILVSNPKAFSRQEAMVEIDGRKVTFRIKPVPGPL